MINTIFTYIKNHLEIGTVLGIIGTLYFYLENRKLKKYDAEKDHRIWKSELEKIDREHENTTELLRKERESKMTIRAGILSDRRPFEEQQVDFSVATQIDKNFWEEREKISAKVDYYEKMKKHSIFWFLKKEEDTFVAFRGPSKLRVLFNKFLRIGK